MKDVNDNPYMRIQGNGKVRMGCDTTASGSFSTAMGQLPREADQQQWAVIPRQNRLQKQ